MRKLTWAVEAFGLGVCSLVLPALLAGCLAEPGARCGLGVCADGKVCDEIHGGCVDPEQLASCAGAANEVACTAPGIADGACFDGVCFPRGCGNGQLEAGEVCDDGNNLFGDRCSADCTSDETCGNGVVDSAKGEACDDGNTDDGDGCQANCVLSTCGDGILDAFENCDDGDANSDDPDGACRTNCQPAGCGDGITDSGEVCDDGNIFAGDGCTPDCASNETCRNGIVDFLAGELCDDQNGLSQDGCSTGCLLEPSTWTERAGLQPVARQEHAMAYDAARDRVVLFGGNDPNRFFDTWEWDGRTWTEVNKGGLTPPEGVMAYDGANRLVVLQSFSGETWTWDGASWSEVTPAGATPGERERFALTYDPIHRRVMLFGGFVLDDQGLQQATNDLWEWDGERWQELMPIGAVPPARINHAIAYDLARERLVLFGGNELSDGTFGATLGDTWVWDGTSWTDVSPAESPDPRAGHAMVYDAQRAVVVMTGNFFLVDTWEWDGASWNPAADFGGSSRLRFPMVYDSTRRRVLLFSGQNGPLSRPIEADTWAYDGVSWIELTPAGAFPPERSDHATAYISSRGETLVFGGRDRESGTSTELLDTWLWNGSVWRQASPTRSPPAVGEAAYDPLRDRVVFVPDGVAEVWEWNGADWIDATPETPIAAPSARSGHAMSFDGERVLLFGGTDGTFEGENNELWAWDGSQWIEIDQPPGGPFPRAHHALAYDQIRDRVVLFGGRDSLDFVGPETFEWDGTEWLEVTPTSTPSPTPRDGHTMVFDRRNRRVVMFGGRVVASFAPLGETWEWDGTVWTEISTSPSPSARTGVAGAYDVARGELVLFGGLGQGTEDFSETWVFSHRALTQPGEGCFSGIDGDSDNLIGCDDPDCVGYCQPHCSPLQSCDAALPQCGDGVCNPDLETQRLCPADCGPPPEICGDFICEGAEDSATCPGDCPS